MLQRMRTARENESGFTLIELLIVIVVLGILASIVVLGLGTFRSDATSAACKADAKQVQTASDAYIAKPTNTTQTPATAVDDATHTATTLVGAGLLKKAPSSTAWAYDPATGDVDDSGC
jgi:prepilin-type N-terminal cleavage/methylation domain-containing protein